MPFDSGGNFSLVSSYKATPGQTIRTEQHNPPLEDIANGLSSVLPRDGRSGMVASLRMGGFPITNVGAGSASTDAATVGQIMLAAPVGLMMPFALKTLPATWIWCDGSVLLANTAYPLLRQALISDGFTYGQDGSGNPKVPDARDTTIVGRGNMGGTARGLLSKFASTTLGALFGVQEHVLTLAQLAKHKHGGKVTGGAHTNTFSYFGVGGVGDIQSGGGYSRFATLTGTTDLSGAHEHPVQEDGGDEPHPNVQPSLVANVIIKAAY